MCCLLKRFVSVITALLLLACQPSGPPPDVIVLGDLHTMSPAKPQVSGVAVHDGRFSFVGDQAAALALRGPDTRVIDLSDATAYPGFIDAHLHIAALHHEAERFEQASVGWRTVLAIDEDHVVARTRLDECEISLMSN